jgi:hypothetical protein
VLWYTPLIRQPASCPVGIAHDMNGRMATSGSEDLTSEGWKTNLGGAGLKPDAGDWPCAGRTTG